MATFNEPQSALLGRLFWMMLGPAILLICATLIFTSPGTGWQTGADVVYLIALAGMILGRWFEHRAGNSCNAMGEPSRPGELRRYIIVASAVGMAVWIAANVVSNFVMR